MATFLLPPSETKLLGGECQPLNLSGLAHPELAHVRTELISTLIALADDLNASTLALKLGSKNAAGEVQRNRELLVSPTTAAMDRYTGVLYDALDASTATADWRERASRHVLVHSALFGLIRCDDLIPAYRLSADSRLSSGTMNSIWGSLNSAVLDALEGPIIDLRSTNYAALGPLPDRDDAVTVRVVSVGDDGETKALNHFNKKGKGEYLRALLDAGEPPYTIAELCATSTELGWPLRPSAPRELELTVPAILGPQR